MKKGEHAGKMAGGDRGLYDYAKIIDDRGTSVVVRRSSAACRPYVWLFVTNAEGKDGVFHLGEWQGASMHMSVREAKLLRDALERFIDAVKGVE